MSARWRLIIDDAGDGAWNMAVDRALLAVHQAGASLPTVRIYSWVHPTVSLGRFQKLSDVHLDVCAAEGIDVCRRPTGGRGVLHDDEITYSIVAGVAEGLPRGVSASYRVLCGALVEAYREIGVAAELTARARGDRTTGACYLHATDADLSLGAAKLSGSAQMWSGDSCLQHGSFVLTRDVAREARVFGLDGGAARALERTTDTIAGALGVRPDPSAIVGRLLEGLARGLGATFERGALREAELEAAAIDVGTYHIAENAHQK